MTSLCVTIQMKATEQYLRLGLFILLYKVVLTFESVDKIPKCNHSSEIYLAVLSCCIVFMITLESVDGILCVLFILL